MHPRLNCLTLWLVILSLSSAARGAEPELKKGVKLPLDGYRLQKWASPEVVDWNGDGMNDVVVGHYSGALFVHLNRGLGRTGFEFERIDILREDGFKRGDTPIWAWRFNKATCVCPGPGRISPRVVDWDQDGKMDLVIGDGLGAQTRIWRNIGTGDTARFSTHHLQYLPPDAGIRPYHETVQPCLADWNSDGKVDLIMGRNRGVYVYLNEGTRRSPHFDFDKSRLGTKIRNLFPPERLCPVLVDWDGDDLQDLLVGSQRGEVWFARNVGSKSQPRFDGYTPVRAGGKDIQVGAEARIAVADLDGDRRMDLLVGGDRGAVWFFQARQPHPVARGQMTRIQRGTPAAIELVGTYDGGRTLTYNVLTQPENGTLSGTAPNLTYTPKKDHQGRDQFTFSVATGQRESAPATVVIEVQPADKPPTIMTQPIDAIVGVGQPASFRVVASGTPPFSYEWKKNGNVIPRATGQVYSIREAQEDGSYSVTVTNVAGSVSSQPVALRVKSLPTEADDVPVIAIKYKSPVIEPSTAGVLTITRTGNTARPVTVNLTSRRGHNPVIADIHFVPTPSSITLKAGQTNAEVHIKPINDTLVNGTQTLTFQIAPNPAYRVASKQGSASMRFLDDDCPQVGISVAKDAPQTFSITAQPAPRRDMEIAYSVGGTAIAGVDYEALPGTVTIPAGETTATISIQSYRQATTGDKKTVVLTLPYQQFTFFDFYRYLNHGRPRVASLRIASSDSSPPAPKQREESPAEPAVEKLRGEVSELGWIVFTARSNGSGSDFDLFVMRPDGTQLRNITNTPRFDEYSARVSPDGKRMLYRRVTKGAKLPTTGHVLSVGEVAVSSWPPKGTLVIANADGGSPQPLGSDGSHAWATWGPKGQRIACLEAVEAKEPAPATPRSASHNRKPSRNIVIRDAETLKVLRSLPSGGIQRQAIWSPDGKRICGPADIPPGEIRLAKGIEYPLGMGKMVSLDIESGKRIPMARFPDWSPVWATDSDGDWFQGGSPRILHSANNYGICPAYYAMLWRSGSRHEPSQLVFAEDKKHIWGGCTSPDDKYAIFVIGGDAWALQGKMAIIRLADAPIARGSSKLFHEVLADFFPTLTAGPVFDLTHVPAGFDPHWTRADLASPKP